LSKNMGWFYQVSQITADEQKSWNFQVASSILEYNIIVNSTADLESLSKLLKGSLKPAHPKF
jgi:hypothetical protein